MPKTLAELKESALGWALAFIVTSFAAGLAWQQKVLSCVPEKYVSLEMYRADQSRDRATLDRIEGNINKLLMIVAQDARKE